MTNIIGNDFGRIWTILLQRLLTTGVFASPRGQATQELLNVHITLADSRNNILASPRRNLNWRFAVAEWLWMIYGRNDLKVLTRHNKRMAEFSDDGETLAGAYGPPLKQQLTYIRYILKTAPTTRQAVLTIWHRNPLASKDIPCTISMQFLRRNSFLHLIVNMRSSDVWLGLPYDVFNFSMILNALAGETNATSGMLMLNIGSSHLYDRDRSSALSCIAEPELSTVRSPALPGFPPADLEKFLENPVTPKTPETNACITNPWYYYAAALTCCNRAEAFNLLKAASVWGAV